VASISRPLAVALLVGTALLGAGAVLHPMLPAELEKQKKYTADSVKAIRNYALPPGAAPAFVFRPLASRARRSRP